MRGSRCSTATHNPQLRGIIVEREAGHDRRHLYTRSGQLRLKLSEELEDKKKRAPCDRDLG